MQMAQLLADHGVEDDGDAEGLLEENGSWPAIKLLVDGGYINHWGHRYTVDQYYRAKASRRKGYIERAAYCMNDSDWDIVAQDAEDRRRERGWGGYY